VVLLDDSASMSATNTQGESSRDRAVRRVLAELDRLGPSARVSLVQSGERPSVLLGPAALAVEARGALENWKPQATQHSLALGIRLAREIAGANGRLMIATDTLPDADKRDAAQRALWVSTGVALANTGITAAQRSISADRSSGVLSLTLENFSSSMARRQIRVTTIETPPREILSRDTDLAPGVSSLNLPLPTGLPPVRVVLSGDALLRDNEVVLVEPRPQIVGVENLLPEGRGRNALAKALDALAGVTRAENAQLSFVAAEALAQPGVPGKWRVGFGKPAGKLVVSGEAQDFAGPYVSEKRHPLLEGVTLNGVVWTGAYPVTSADIHPLISTGERPLLMSLGPTGEAGFLFNLDLDRTNLVRAPDWPILLSNFVESRRLQLPGPERWNYRIGEWIRIRLGREPAGPLRVRTGSVSRDLPPNSVLEFIAPATGGLVRVMEGDKALYELGVNFLDEEEGDLRRAASGDAGAFETAAASLRTESGPGSDPLFWILFVVGAAAIVGDWCSLAQRP
jgi:von Willebrand factor type A domain